MRPEAKRTYMSKRDLKKYLAQLDKPQIEEQFLALYDKFPEVKTYYDFVFNPREDKLVEAAKIKIANEYFPTKTKRAKLRRSTAQKIIKHFLSLGVDAYHVADVMLFSIEVAQKYSGKRQMYYASFYSSMLKSFEQAAQFIYDRGIRADFTKRLDAIANVAQTQRWENAPAFETVLERLEEKSQNDSAWI